MHFYTKNMSSFGETKCKIGKNNGGESPRLKMDLEPYVQPENC